MFTDVSSLWNSASTAFNSLNENFSEALDRLDNEAQEDEEGNDVSPGQSEAEIYKKLLDDAQMQHFQLSKQFRSLMSEKESELKHWKEKYLEASGQEAEEDSKEKKEVDGEGKEKEEQSVREKPMTSEEKDLLLVKTQAEIQVLKDCMEEVEQELKQTLHNKNEVAAYQKKVADLERQLLEWKKQTKEVNAASSADLKMKTEEIDDLVSEYSKLSSESERQRSTDQQRIQEIERENEILTLRMQTLEQSLTELADRSSGSSSSTSAPSSSSGEEGSQETKELKARVVHLEYDVKSKDAIISELRAQLQSDKPSVQDSSSEDSRSLQLLLSTKVEEIANLQEDIARLQMEKKEAESVGRSSLEQLKKLQQSRTAEESSLEKKTQQDRLDAESKDKEISSLKNEIAQLQTSLEELQKSSGDSKQSLDDMQKRSAATEEELRNKLDDTESRLHKADAARAEVEETVKVLRGEVEESSKLAEEKSNLIAMKETELESLREELQCREKAIAEQQSEWQLKLSNIEAQAQDSESSAVKQLKQALADQQTSSADTLRKAEAEWQAKVEALEAQLTSCKQDWENQAKSLVEEHEQALKKQASELESQAEERRKGEVELAVANERQSAENRLSEALEEKEKLVKESCQAAEKVALSALSAELAEAKQQEVAELLEKHERQCSELEQQLLSKQQSALDELQHRLADSHKAELSELTAAKAKELEAAMEEAATRLAEAKQESADKLEALATQHREEVDTIVAAKEAIQKELEGIEETHRLKTEAAISSIRTECEEAQAAAVAAVKQEMQSLVDDANAAREEYLQLYTKESKARKAIHNKLMEIQGNIRVVCRVRPILDVERKQSKGGAVDATEILSEEDIVVHRDASTKNRFEFDRVFPPGGTQSEVFASVQPLVVSVLDGYNVCIFAYGQTGSGKTYTMEGYGDDPDSKGVSPRAISELFSHIDKTSDNWSYVVQFSMLEIYNETIRDLLVEPPSGSKPNEAITKLDIRQTATGNVVAGLTEVAVESPDEVLNLMARGQRNRAVGAHDMNEHSSRSHSILTLTARGVNNKDGSTSCGKLHLIDLAGSERVSKTDATGDRLKEAQNINRSLSALGDVINSLGGKKSSHVPYRNSKLTFLLQDSLGGNSKVLMFVNISPAVYNVGESICSLNFAFRCRNVELGQAKKQIANGSAGSGSNGGSSSSISTPSKIPSAGSSMRRSTSSTLKK